MRFANACQLVRMAACRLPPVLPPEPVRYVIRLDTSCHTGGFGLLLAATLLVALLYLSESICVSRHDTLYSAMLPPAWAAYLPSGRLLHMPFLGPHWRLPVGCLPR